MLSLKRLLVGLLHSFWSSHFPTTFLTISSHSIHLRSKSEGCASAVKRILGKVDGVSNVETNVAAKTVVVTADPSASPELMLEKLMKWSSASGKSVELAS